jgi:hypothetical protein
MQRFWDSNDRALQRLLVAFKLAAGSMAVEVLALIAAVSGTIL